MFTFIYGDCVNLPFAATLAGSAYLQTKSHFSTVSHHPHIYHSSGYRILEEFQQTSSINMVGWNDWIPDVFPAEIGLFDPMYLNHNGKIEVIGDNIRFPVRRNHIRKFFPWMNAGLHEIRLWQVSEQYARRLKVHGVHHRTVVRTLTDVFLALNESVESSELFRTLILQRLQESLMSDINFAHTPEGLFRCRRRFLILAAFAKTTRSAILASILANFLLVKQQCILRHERSRYLISWGLAVMDIHLWLTPSDSDNCFAALTHRLEDILCSHHYMRYYDNRLPKLMDRLQLIRSMSPGFLPFDPCNNRGRPPHRPLFYDGPRAITMPPPVTHIHHVHAHQPRYLPSPGILTPNTVPPSPSPSMNLALTGDYFDGNVEGEVGNIAERQDILERKVHHLEHGMMHLIG
jgi:hypothetical protein